MRMNNESSQPPRWIVFGTALVYFALGSVLTAHFMHLKEAWADSHHAFQLEIHHAVPGKVPALQQRFRRGREEAKTHWDAFHTDPAFQEYVDSKEAEQLIEGVDATSTRRTDYSAMK
jgi:hypothetical protein